MPAALAIYAHIARWDRSGYTRTRRRTSAGKHVAGDHRKHRTPFPLVSYAGTRFWTSLRPPLPSIVVNSLADSATPPAGTATLRSALAAAAPGQRIVFDASLDGGTIALSIVADEHTLLKGEVMGIRDEPSGPVSYLVGWFDRDYGRSALVARKDVVIDASGLASGITLAWDGGAQPGARVLAVDGDLTLVNVSITGGRSVTEAIPSSGQYPQPWTLARGGAVAVWGLARLAHCRLHDNHVQGDFDSSRVLNTLWYKTIWYGIKEV